MSGLTEDERIRASTHAAQNFVDSYYNAFNSMRHTLESFYVPASMPATGRPLPLITYNGQQLSDPQIFQSTYTEQMPFTYFEVQSFDVGVINPSIAPIDNASTGKGRIKELENNMSLLVQVSGYVRLLERRDGPMRGFSDTLTLVPNKEAAGAKGKGKVGEGKSWVIQSQNFRFVV